MYSQTYLAIIVSVLGSLLPKLGVTVGSEELTSAVSLLFTIGGALWALVRRYQAGGVGTLGFRK